MTSREDATATPPGPNGWWAAWRATRQDDRGAAWRRFGERLEAAGRERAAVGAYRRAMARDPVDFPSRHRAAALLQGQGETRAAEAIDRELLTINPHDAAAAAQLGHLLVDRGHTRGYHEAEGLLRRALSLGARRPAVLVPLCQLLAAQEREEEILALTGEDTEPPILLQRGQAEAALGRFEEARTSFQAVLRQEPENARAWYHLAGLRLTEGAPAVVGLADRSEVAGHLARHAEAAEQPHREWWAFAAAYALEEAGDDDAAWAWYGEGNGLVRARVPSNVAAIEAYERRLVATYTPEVLNHLTRGQLTTPGPAPVFVVGMPRSGTTLLERLIGAHPEAAPLGERADLQEIMAAMTPNDASARQPWPERAATLAPVAAGSIAGAYLARVHALAPAGARVAVDKMPEQFRHIGLIAATMPQARILHLVRDPRDVGVSCYTARFHDGLAWSFDRDSIARRQASYAAVMAHWRRVLPAGRMLEVPYEGLVRDPETWVARVLHFLGLAWEPACVHGHRETAGPVRTSSVAQVRGGISTASVGRWRRFGEARLGPLAPNGAAPTDHDQTTTIGETQ